MRINSLWLLAALFLFVPVVQVTSLVLGIDLGSHYFKLAVVRPGGVEIVENEKSGRKTPFIVAFRELDEVFVGDPAAQVSSRNPSLTFPFLKEISGRERALVDVLQHWGPVLPYKDRLGLDEEGHVTVDLTDLQVTGVNEGVMPTNYTTTELLAILFGRISQLTDHFVGSHVIDCVIAVPHWLDQSTRAQLAVAAEAAGLKVLSLQSDIGAVAVHYAMNRRAEGSEEGASHVLFVDQGETHAQFGVVSFAKDTKNSNKATHFSQATVKAVEWVEVGGRDLDNAILSHVIAKYGVKSLEERPRTLALARKQVKRVKEVLTANKEAHFTIENMHGEGRDLTGVVTREEFEQVTAALYSRVIGALDHVLAAANVSAEQLSAVELVGGSTRVPKFQELLKHHLQRATLDKHLNGDEAAVLGAAMSAASLSTQHRLSRKIALKDLNSYPVQARIATALADDAINGKEMFLFTEHHRLGSKKTVSFLTASDAFDIHLAYNLTGDRALPVGVSPNLATYRISEIPLRDQNGEPIKPKVHVAFKLTSSGTVTCDSAEAEYTVAVESPVTDSETKNSDEKSDEAKTADAENGNASENSDANNSDEGEANNSNDSESPDSDETAQNGNEQPTKSVKTRVVRVNLKVTAEGPIIRSVKQVTAAAAKVKSLQAAQQEREEIDSLHNQIESLLYETRDQINDPTTKLVKFSYAHERAALNEVLDSVSTWMDDVIGVKVSKADLKARIKSIQELVTPVKDRALQLDRRTEHVTQCHNVLNLTRAVVTGNFTAVRNVTEEEVAELFALVDETAQWLETRVKEQTARDELVTSLHAQLMQGSDSSTWVSEHGEYLTPVISSAEIAEKCALVQARTRLLIMRPKRAPKKESESATEASESEESTNPEPAEQTNQEQDSAEQQSTNQEQPLKDEL